MLIWQGSKADEVLHIATRFSQSQMSTSVLCHITAGAWSPGCSLLAILGYGEACMNPGRGPGSPPPPTASGPDFAASRTTGGCGFSSRARCGSSHRRALCCDRPASGPSSCGCCFGFSGPDLESKEMVRIKVLCIHQRTYSTLDSLIECGPKTQ